MSPFRLGVRTMLFQGINTGSSPVRDIVIIKSYYFMIRFQNFKFYLFLFFLYFFSLFIFFDLTLVFFKNYSILLSNSNFFSTLLLINEDLVKIIYLQFDSLFFRFLKHPQTVYFERAFDKTLPFHQKKSLT